MAWTALTLATDGDLSKYEPEMPTAAQTAGKSGQSAYASKRELAKRDIASALRRRALDPDGIQDATQLTHAAVCCELAYIYRALGRKSDSVDIEKAAYYQEAFETEMASVVLDYIDPGATQDAQVRPTVIFARG